MATTTPADLTQDLQYRLRAAGMDRGMATAVTDLLPPAGQHELCTELRDNPDALRELGHTWPGALADRPVAGGGPMTTTTATGTLERNLEFLRLIGDGHLADMILRLPEARRARAAASVVRLENPARDAILTASHGELPAVVAHLLSREPVR